VRDFFRQPLLEQINLKHPLARLAGLIDWEHLGAAMSKSFVSRAGRPATSPRLIAGCFICNTHLGCPQKTDFFVR